MEHRRARLVYTTFPDLDTGLRIGETLVRDGLAACVNVFPGMRSVYAWKGAIEQGAEAAAFLKTVSEREAELRAALKARHPYETPIILSLAVADADADTLAWLSAETAGRAPGTAGPAGGR